MAGESTDLFDSQLSTGPEGSIEPDPGYLGGIRWHLAGSLQGYPVARWRGHGA